MQVKRGLSRASPLGYICVGSSTLACKNATHVFFPSGLEEDDSKSSHAGQQQHNAGRLRSCGKAKVDGTQRAVRAAIGSAQQREGSQVVVKRCAGRQGQLKQVAGDGLSAQQGTCKVEEEVIVIQG